MKALLVACLALAAAVPAAAQPKITSRVEYYDVSGSTAEQVRASIDRERRKLKAGQHDGLTTVQFRFDYEPVRKGGAWVAGGVSVSEDIVIHVPRWTGYDQAPPEFQRQWKDYSDGLMVHEQGHADRNAAAAPEIEKAILSATARQARQLDSPVKQAVQKVMNRLQIEQKQYDVQTRSGATQGASFPPGRAPEPRARAERPERKR